MNGKDISWGGAPQEPHVFPSRSDARLRRDRFKAWVAHQPLVHRLLDVALVGGLPGLGAYARLVAPHAVEVTEHRVPIARLPEPLVGLRIVQLSDLHLGHNVPRPYVEHCFRLANACRPDIVVLTGDYLQWDAGYIEILAELLTTLEAPHGVVAVLGNHDYGLNSPGGTRMLDHATLHLVDAMSAAGVHVLRNAVHVVERAGATLAFVGVDDLWSGECDPDTAFRACPGAAPRIFLCHNPDGFGYRQRFAFDLMLSGHTHGAQVRVPGSRHFMPVRDDRLFAGFYGHPGAWLFVNRGIGYVWRVRWNSAPEVSCHTLEREEEAARPQSYRRVRHRWRRDVALGRRRGR